MLLPALRAVDAFPMTHEEQEMYCLYDPSEMVTEQLILAPVALFIAQCLDGQHTLENVQARFHTESGGMELPEDAINEVVALLDEHGFLDTDRFRAIQAEVETTFHESSKRPAYLAGKSYPEHPDECEEFVEQQFLREEGPGNVPDDAEEGSPGHLPGLIVPHIDLHRGGHSYAHGYSHLAKYEKPDVVLVFGVAHAAEPVPFILSRKDFETPLGLLSTDREIVDKLAESCSWDPFAFEMTHRTEHSIEFQALMLARQYGPDVKIVPVLTSWFGEGEDADIDWAPIHEFLDTCRQVVGGEDKKVMVMASVDLAHVGRRFGDPFDIDDEIIDEVSKRDVEDLTFVESVNPTSFYLSVMKDGNQRNVCGVNAIYSALHVLEGSGVIGRPLHYDYAHDPAGGIVSFCSFALEPAT
jgi:hypothetical protein